MIARAIAAAVLLLAFAVPAQETARGVYVGVADDPHYQPRRAYTGILLQDLKRPVDGARLAMRGTRIPGRALGMGFELQEILLEPDAPAAPAVTVALEGGALAVLLDLPAAQMAAVLATPRPGTGTLVNIRHRAARWRGADCAAKLVHTIPSNAMLSDALAQHLRASGWDRVLLLSGETGADTVRTEAARRSIAKFGLTLADHRTFALTNDPRARDRANIRLLTGDVRAEVLWVIDTVGEFDRLVPYTTYHPTPVLGTEGLTATAWHPAYDRHGAPQLNQRFRRAADREMTAEDWATWGAVRMVVEGVSRIGRADPGAVAAHIRSEALSLDLYKGIPGSVRPWNGQLRHATELIRFALYGQMNWTALAVVAGAGALFMGAAIYAYDPSKDLIARRGR